MVHGAVLDEAVSGEAVREGGLIDDARADALVAAASALLDEVGLEGVTIRAVLARTGLARRAFYDRFGGKDHLMLGVFRASLRDAAAQFACQIAADERGAASDPLAALQLVVTGIVLGRAQLARDGEWEGSRRSAALSREHLRLAEAQPRELRAAVRPLIDLLADQLALGMAKGSVRRADPHRLASLMYNLVSTSVHAELLAEEDGQPDRLRREQLASDVWQFCQRAIVA